MRAMGGMRSMRAMRGMRGMRGMGRETQVFGRGVLQYKRARLYGIPRPFNHGIRGCFQPLRQFLGNRRGGLDGQAGGECHDRSQERFLLHKFADMRAVTGQGRFFFH